MYVTINDIRKHIGTLNSCGITRVSYINSKIKDLIGRKHKISLLSNNINSFYLILDFDDSLTNKICLVIENFVWLSSSKKQVFKFNLDNYGIRQLKIKIYKEFGWIK